FTPGQPGSTPFPYTTLFRSGNKTRFCTMGAVSDWVNMGDLGRMRMWLLAIAVALLGSSALQLAGVVDLSKSIYPSPNFTWLSYVDRKSTRLNSSHLVISYAV